MIIRFHASNIQIGDVVCGEHFNKGLVIDYKGDYLVVQIQSQQTLDCPKNLVEPYHSKHQHFRKFSSFSC
jgi:hypothetical protein